jgi:hypothetical protein
LEPLTGLDGENLRDHCTDVNLSCSFLLETWVKCDDDKISHITGEEVLKLSGGGISLVLTLILAISLNPQLCYPNPNH